MSTPSHSVRIYLYYFHVHRLCLSRLYIAQNLPRACCRMDRSRGAQVHLLQPICLKYQPQISVGTLRQHSFYHISIIQTRQYWSLSHLSSCCCYGYICFLRHFLSFSFLRRSHRESVITLLQTMLPMSPDISISHLQTLLSLRLNIQSPAFFYALLLLQTLLMDSFLPF